MHDPPQTSDGYWSNADDAVDAYHESLAMDVAHGAPAATIQESYTAGKAAQQIRNALFLLQQAKCAMSPDSANSTPLKTETLVLINVTIATCESTLRRISRIDAETGPF